MPTPNIDNEPISNSISLQNYSPIDNTKIEAIHKDLEAETVHSNSDSNEERLKELWLKWQIRFQEDINDVLSDYRQCKNDKILTINDEALLLKLFRNLDTLTKVFKIGIDTYTSLTEHTKEEMEKLQK